MYIYCFACMYGMYVYVCVVVCVCTISTVSEAKRMLDTLELGLGMDVSHHVGAESQI